MKFHLKDFTLRQYIRHVRRQSKHVQHLHAFAFAGIITALIAGVLLYTEYGFWHERYIAEDALTSYAPEKHESPSQSFGSFLMEAKARFGSIGTAGTNLLEGKDTYTKDSN